MHEISIESLPQLPVSEHLTEYVERKGLGHPDSICDALMESVSVALTKEYLKVAGHVLHYNLDKGLLVAGQTTPAFGGGVVNAPLRIVLGDRATTQYKDTPIPVNDIVEHAAGRWLTENLRFVDPDRHVVLQNEIKPGSAALADIFARDRIVANDTSAAVGYAPLSETELLVLAAEHWLNSADVKSRLPEIGEDVKVMGVRQGRQLHLTVAVAFVDRFVPDANTYFQLKETICQELKHHLDGQIAQLDGITIHLNTLDDPARGLDGLYLTVLGTSAESGDGGEVGRGNSVCGVISLNRPTSNEAAAGKNPASHVGKIYNLLSYQIAERVYRELDAVDEVYVWLCSQIGRPVELPWFASAQVVLARDAALPDVESHTRAIMQEEIAAVPKFVERLLRGELPVC